MKSFFKLGLALFGFALAFIAFSNNATAGNTKVSDKPSTGGGCYGSGDCGTTANGTKLVGRWRE